MRMLRTSFQANFIATMNCNHNLKHHNGAQTNSLNLHKYIFSILLVLGKFNSLITS